FFFLFPTERAKLSRGDEETVCGDPIFVRTMADHAGHAFLNVELRPTASLAKCLILYQRAMAREASRVPRYLVVLVPQGCAEELLHRPGPGSLVRALDRGWLLGVDDVICVGVLIVLLPQKRLVAAADNLLALHPVLWSVAAMAATVGTGARTNVGQRR